MPWGRATSCTQHTGQHGASLLERMTQHESSHGPSQTTQRACLAGRPCCTVPPCDRLHVTQGLPSSGGLYPVPMLGSRLARTVQVRVRVHADSARRWCARGAGTGVFVCVYVCGQDRAVAESSPLGGVDGASGLALCVNSLCRRCHVQFRAGGRGVVVQSIGSAVGGRGGGHGWSVAAALDNNARTGTSSVDRARQMPGGGKGCGENNSGRARRDAMGALSSTAGQASSTPATRPGRRQ
jgi:hypothetical protein